jgi:hypothetical protein
LKKYCVSENVNQFLVGEGNMNRVPLSWGRWHGGNHLGNATCIKLAKIQTIPNLLIKAQGKWHELIFLKWVLVLVLYEFINHFSSHSNL